MIQTTLGEIYNGFTGSGRLDRGIRSRKIAVNRSQSILSALVTHSGGFGGKGIRKTNAEQMP